MEIFNSVNFENLIFMNLYSLLISNKIRIYIKMNNVKALKNMKLALFPRRILSCKQDCLHIRPQILTISDGMIKVATWLHQ